MNILIFINGIFTAVIVGVSIARIQNEEKTKKLDIAIVIISLIMLFINLINSI